MTLGVQKFFRSSPSGRDRRALPRPRTSVLANDASSPSNRYQICKTGVVVLVGLMVQPRKGHDPAQTAVAQRGEERDALS